MTSELDVARRLGEDVPGPQRVPWAGVVARLRGSTAVRRLVPLPVAVGAVRLGYRLALGDPQRLAAAREAMAAVVGGTPREADLDALARRHPAARAEAVEISWRPWLLRKTPIDHPERLLGPRGNRGLIMSYVHAGPWYLTLGVLAALSPTYGVVGDWYFEPPPPGYPGYWFEHSRRIARNVGDPVILARGSRPVIGEVLRRGHVVTLAWDMPGSTPTDFLGKKVFTASGTARLAVETDALVVPTSSVPGRWGRWRLEVGEPMDPRDHGDWRTLHQALADWHGPRILRTPEYLEPPVRPGAWAAADRTGWYAAPRQQHGEGG